MFYSCLPCFPSLLPSFHFVKTCFSDRLCLSSSLPLTPYNSSLHFLSTYNSISPTFLFSSPALLQGKENDLIVKYINPVTSTTYVSFFKCSMYTHMHPGSLHTQTSVIVLSVQVTSIMRTAFVFSPDLTD